MTQLFRVLLLAALSCGATTLARAQAFAGSDDFSGGDTKWAYFFRPTSGTNGLLTFTGSVLEFTKAAGEGSYFLGWDGDGNSTNTVSRTTASYTTSWAMNITATNRVTGETGKFASVGIEASAASGSYTAVILSNIDGRLYVVGESNAIGRNVKVAAPIDADVRLRLAWDAPGKKLIGSYSFDGGVTFKTLMTTAISVWPTSPASTGFFLEAFGRATTTAAVVAGQMRMDNFSVAATQTFVGSDDFSGGDGKWDYAFRPAYLTSGTNGLYTFNGSVLEFTKGAGKGSYFLGWDGDGIAGNTTNRIPASYTTSWVMEATATNRVVSENGAFCAVGIEVAVAPDAYTEITLSNANGTLYVRAEALSADDPGVNVAAPINASIRLRLAWNATTRVLTTSYSVNEGASYTVLRTVPITAWPKQPTDGFFFELEGFSTTAAAIPAGQMQLDNFSITAVPQVTAQPAPISVTLGTPIALSAPVTASESATLQWQRNGSNLTGATSEALTIDNAQPANTGLYQALVTNTAGALTTPAAIVGLSSTAKVVGSGQEIGTDIFVASNGNTFDQVALQGAAATITADPGQIVRMSFIDSTEDIVQVEFAGAGTLSLVLDNVSGPALPANYNQAQTYMKGHAGIVVTDADETTNLSVFSVGRGTAVNQALFKDSVHYDGLADIAFVAISSKNGRFGGLRTANASYFATKGLTGLYAPGVQFSGPVFIGDINAFDNATPIIVLGGVLGTGGPNSVAGEVRITGGDLLQANGRAIQVSGFTRLLMAAGTTSHYVSTDSSTANQFINAQANKARLEQDGVDVTAQIVVNP